MQTNRRREIPTEYGTWSTDLVPTPDQAPANAGEGAARCVLIVDRAQGSLQLLPAMLRMAGVDDVRAVADCRLAVDTCLEYPPDLVVIDLDVRRADGLALLTSLREVLTEERFLPIVALTSDPTVHARVLAFAAGANDYFAGPLDELVFIERVRNLLTMRRLYLRVHRHNLELRGIESSA